MIRSCNESLCNQGCCCLRRVTISDCSLAAASSDHFSNYCRDTSIHGLQYVGDRSRPRPERILWAVLFVCCIAASAHLIRELWMKWERSPVIVTFDETSLPVWKVPFPAVTICSETKSRQRVFNYTEAYNNLDNLTGIRLKKFEDLSLICNYVYYNKGDPLVNISTLELFKEVAPTIEDTIIYLFYQEFDGYYGPLLFRPLLTEEGICYTFNMLNATDIFNKEVLQLEEGYLDYDIGQTDWSPDFGYDSSANISAYPRRALGSGIYNGLTVFLKVYQDDMDYICRGPVDGFKILLHNPAEVPRIADHFIHVPISHHVTVSARPTMITTSEGLRDYSPHRRQCYFSYERKLRYFRHYTYQNCYIECLTNHTLSKCGCVSFYMPRTEGIPICGTGSSDCIYDGHDELFQQEIQESLNAEGKMNTNTDKCDCLPACTSLEFDSETSIADILVNKFFTAREMNLSMYEGVKFAAVSIYLKDKQFIPSRRSELYGRTDFLANCGGLLGLFMGVSILSLVEIVYYFSVRIFCSFFGRMEVKSRNRV